MDGRAITFPLRGYACGVPAVRMSDSGGDFSVAAETAPEDMQTVRSR